LLLLRAQKYGVRYQALGDRFFVVLISRYRGKIVCITTTSISKLMNNHLHHCQLWDSLPANKQACFSTKKNYECGHL